MKRRMADLAHRRHLLLARISAQRGELTRHCELLQRPLALADSGLRVVRYLHDHPAALAGSLAAFLALRRSSLLDLAKTGWRLLYLYPSLLNFAWQVLSPRRVVTRNNTQTEKGA